MKKFTLTIFAIIYAVSLYGADSKKSAKDYIADLKSSKDEKIIMKAADWVAKKEEKDAVPNLIKLLSDSRENVRLHAVMALGYLGDEKTADPISKLLLNDSSSTVRYAALLSSLRIGSEKSYKAILDAKKNETDPYIQDLLTKIEKKLKKK